MFTARSNGINLPYSLEKYNLVLKERLHSKKIHAPIYISIFCAQYTASCFRNRVPNKDRFQTVGSTGSYKMRIEIL